MKYFDISFLAAIMITLSICILMHWLGESVTIFKFFVLYCLNSIGLKVYNSHTIEIIHNYTKGERNE